MGITRVVGLGEVVVILNSGRGYIVRTAPLHELFFAILLTNLRLIFAL